MKRAHIIVAGIVQGVSFRAFAKAEADRLKISGWVKNLPDGSVEILAQGNEKYLERFISRMRRGPKSARIRNVKINCSDAIGEFENFEIRR